MTMALSNFRPIRGKVEYALWLAKTAGANGVYVIRQKARKGQKGKILYIGESHTHRLRETLQRHYQDWNGKTAGPTFNASRTEVAIEIFLLGDDAIRRQNELIRKHKPQYNTVIPDVENDPQDRRRGTRKTREEAAYEELANFFESVAL